MSKGESQVEYLGRPYVHGDGPSINALYQRITGVGRSMEAFEWQWLGAPGGHGEMWLIEAVQPDGRRRLIGHHGIMPIWFSRGREELLFGKTENTFVDPEYRERILYPRFEQRFAKQYEGRFDALFSTTGPTAAIRQRVAQGYEFVSPWRRAIIPSSWPGIVGAGASAGRRRFGWLPLRGAALGAARLAKRIHRRLAWVALADDQAQRHSFFDGFWDDACESYPLTPRRHHADLAWRFWNNPNYSYETIVVGSAGPATGFLIVRRSEKGGIPWAVIEDIVPSRPTSESFSHLLRCVQEWAVEAGITWLMMTTTVDSTLSGLGTALDTTRPRMPRKLYDFATSKPAMPRKITARGRTRDLSANGWYVTGMVFQGGPSVE